MKKEELSKILENHKHWLNEDCEGWENMRANLRDADLSYADLSYADLHDADLSYADLHDADLSSADLRDANLRGANLRDADLRDANLRSADLRYANLCGAKKAPYIPMICPEEDMFIGWKKASGKIVKLEIPADAKRSSATTRKCRCDKARVIAIYELDGTLSEAREVASSRDSDFIYKVGQFVEVADFDKDRWNECSTGIHFFINRQEAIDY